MYLLHDVLRPTSGLPDSITTAFSNPSKMKYVPFTKTILNPLPNSLRETIVPPLVVGKRWLYINMIVVPNLHYEQ